MGSGLCLVELERRHDLAREATKARLCAELETQFEHGGVAEAALRALIYVRLPGGTADERGFAMIQAVRAAQPADRRLSLSELRDVLRTQYLLVRLDERRAIRAIPQLLPREQAPRRAALDALRRVLGARARVPRRGMLTDLLRDLEEGTCSVLERGYLHLVERPHGLPKMNRQVRDVLDGRTLYRDGEYAAYGLVIELDGLAHHSGAEARARDSVRDLETLAERGELTVRLTHRQVFREHCRSAALVGKILQRQGWPGRPKRCPLCPGR